MGNLEINRNGRPDSCHMLSETPQELTEIQISHEIFFAFSRINTDICYCWLDDLLSGLEMSDVSGFV